MDENLFSVFKRHVPAPEARLMETQDGWHLSYAATFEMAERFAAVLTGLQVQPGDRVAVQIDKSPEAIALYLGCAAAGAVFLPLNTAYTPAEVEFFVGDAEPRVLVASPERSAALRPVAAAKGACLETMGARGEGTLLERLREVQPGFAPVPRTGDDLAAILYTSGTTGRSKGAMLSHANLTSNAFTLVDYWRFTKDDVLLHALPIFHTHGLFVATNVTLLAGGSMLFLPGFDADTVLRLLPRATAMMGVPTFYSRLLARPEFTADLCRNMRLFVSGSAPLSAEVHKAFFERTGHAILERYGMTETNMNTSNPYADERRPGTVGFPLPGVDLRIADRETGEILPKGAVGVIEVKGPNVFKGYWNLPEKTQEEFRADGFFVTGDMGMIDERGYVHIVGRDKDLIITGGFNVYPAEVEALIDAIPGVAESAVIGLPHPDFGEGVTAVVALKPGAQLTEDAIKAALAEKLAKFKQPKRVFFVPSLKRNTMGKIQKVELRADYAGTFA
ncbi:MAG: malonyl-CoA synthase [Geminicoccaceae bacterium]|nr:MAG: malonyl-CoA synthase [Geminicoccaceae bacterium]